MSSSSILENKNKYSDYNDDGKVKFRDDIKHAILIGIISQSQYLAEAAQDDEGEERQQMSDQVRHLVIDIHTDIQIFVVDDIKNPTGSVLDQCTYQCWSQMY